MATYKNLLEDHLNLSKEAVFTIACYYEDYKLIDKLLIKEKDNSDRWLSCVNLRGLENACSAGNLNSIEYIVKNKQVDLNNNIYLIESIHNNNKFVLNYFSCINPYILFIIYEETNKINSNYKDNGSIYLLEKFIKKIKIIQQWVKSILYNPRTKRGRERLENEYDSLIH